MMIDALDRAILEVLVADGRASLRAVARAVGSTTPTVSARVKRMHDLGVIRGFSVVLGPAAGAPSTAPRPAIDPHVWRPAILCHTCGGPLPDVPVEVRIADRAHVFCCVTCRDRMVRRARAVGADPGPA